MSNRRALNSTRPGQQEMQQPTAPADTTNCHIYLVSRVTDVGVERLGDTAVVHIALAPGAGYRPVERKREMGSFGFKRPISVRLPDSTDSDELMLGRFVQQLTALRDSSAKTRFLFRDDATFARLCADGFEDVYIPTAAVIESLVVQ